METKHYVIVKVLDENGNWYNNAYIENDFDALLVARFYTNVLMLDIGKTVVVKKFD